MNSQHFCIVFFSDYTTDEWPENSEEDRDSDYDDEVLHSEDFEGLDSEEEEELEDLRRRSVNRRQSGPRQGNLLIQDQAVDMGEDYESDEAEYDSDESEAAAQPVSDDSDASDYEGDDEDDTCHVIYRRAKFGRHIIDSDDE